MASVIIAKYQTTLYESSPNIYREQKSAIRNNVIPNSLISNMFQPDGDKEARTPDPYNAIVVLYQLSYDPKLVLNLLDRVSSCQDASASCPPSTILAPHQQGTHEGMPYRLTINLEKSASDDWDLRRNWQI
jgi:hypothetical protein